MREFSYKKDPSKKSFGDRFFIPKESEKLSPDESGFDGEAKILESFEILEIYVEFNQLVVFINKDDNKTVLKALKEYGYEILSELSGVDFIEKKGGIEVFYQLLSLKHKRRVRIKCLVKSGEFLQSVSEVYKSANWSERELYDMMGVWFKNHPNLKRILMPDDWYGHPLLKSYPLHGDERAKWYEIDKIYGRENREKFGEENRDPAFIDSKDTFNFARIYHDTEQGGEIPSSPNRNEPQEDGGVPLVKKVKMDKFRLIKFRERK